MDEEFKDIPLNTLDMTQTFGRRFDRYKQIQRMGVHLAVVYEVDEHYHVYLYRLPFANSDVRLLQFVERRIIHKECLRINYSIFEQLGVVNH
jgi:hypothetical protein